jgi:hypothetical protein
LGVIHKSVISLRFFGDDLDPEEITARLGGQPTVGVRKGGTWRTASGAEKVSRRGSWRLAAERVQPGDLDGEIAKMFAPLTTDMDVWREFSGRYGGDIFVGLFMADENEGISVSPETLAALGARGLTLDLDIYYYGSAEDEHC